MKILWKGKETVFPQNFHTRKLGETMVFYTVKLSAKRKWGFVRLTVFFHNLVMKGNKRRPITTLF